jgi:hypothetical protein
MGVEGRTPVSSHGGAWSSSVRPTRSEVNSRRQRPAPRRYRLPVQPELQDSVEHGQSGYAGLPAFAAVLST